MSSFNDDDKPKNKNKVTSYYKVGYKKPPEVTQFQPGQSGNPKGRSKEQKTISELFEEEFKREIIVTDKNGSKKITKYKALVIKIVNAALSGDYKSQKLSLQFLSNAKKIKDFEILPDDWEVFERFTKKLIESKENMEEEYE